MGQLTIRPYCGQDWSRIAAIHDSARKQELAWAGLSGAFLPLETAAEREGLFDYTVQVAELDGLVVGFTAYTQEELAWLYVDPDYMGRGVGKSLVQYVLDHTARPLSIEVLYGNLPALGLYQSMGFALAGTVHGVMPGNEDFPVTVYCLEKA